MPQILFHPAVAVEIKASYEWYQNQSELESAYQTITELPDTWPKFNTDYRKFLLGKFPFSVIYRENKGYIFVVAVMHNSRKPNYWKNRK